jgi:hypothetical protein
MTHREALDLIDTPALRAFTTALRAAAATSATAAASNGQPMHWADLGCGSGTFTLALADLLAPGSAIEAIDLRPGIPAQTTSRGVTIRPRTADFTTLHFATPSRTAPGPNDATPEIIPDRAWPGTQPLMYHGILMANALHYVANQSAFLTRLKTNAILLIEYDIDLPVARWVPYPLSYNKALSLLKSTGWPKVQKLGTHPSAFGNSELYAALALPAEWLP